MTLLKFITRTGRILIAFALCLLMSQCDIKKSDANPSESFTTIYDHPDINLSFYPVDFVQTSDDGYLVLSVYTDTALSTFPLIRLMKTDKNGKMLKEMPVENTWCSAVPSLMQRGNAWQFVCMDAVNQNVKLLETTGDLTGINEVAELSGKYPLYLYAADDWFAVLSFDRIARTSVVTKYSTDGTLLVQNNFFINEDYKNQVETHLKKGKQFPFFITPAGPSSSHYLVNCFYNYTMTLLFVNASNGNLTGQLNTYQDDAAISAAVYLDASRFSISRYYMGENYVIPSVDLNLNTIQGTDTFEDTKLPELVEDAISRMLITTMHGKEVIVYASETKSNHLVIYFFEKSTGKLLTSKSLNSTNPVDIADLIVTADGGLAILAQTYVAGRFPRISIFKVAAGDIKF
jgi:hypothetical protein